MPLLVPANAPPSLWSAHCGGCAIAVHADTPIRGVPPATDAGRQLWEASRWCHATITWGNGRSFLHVASIYAP